jgi:hypothetical protein
MAKGEKTAQESQRSSWDAGDCVAMMEKMSAQMEGVCDCAGIMAQTSNEEENSGEWLEAMSEMMRSFCAPRSGAAAAEKEESHE